MSDSMNEWMKKVIEASSKKISERELFCSILSPNYIENPQCALELGLAILMDKPIVILAQENQNIPTILKKVAFAIETYKGPDDMQQAMDRLIVKMKEWKP